MCVTTSRVLSLLSVQTLDSVSCLDSDDTLCPAGRRMESGTGPAGHVSSWPAALLKGLHWWVRGRQAQLELLAEVVTRSPRCSWSWMMLARGRARGVSAVPGPREPECGCYPVPWLSLKDPKNLYHGCPAKGLCNLRAGARPQLASLTPFPVGQKPFCCCSSHKAVPDLS